VVAWRSGKRITEFGGSLRAGFLFHARRAPTRTKGYWRHRESDRRYVPTTNLGGLRSLCRFLGLSFWCFVSPQHQLESVYPHHEIAEYGRLLDQLVSREMFQFSQSAARL
jgi:hypothetical protein